MDARKVGEHKLPNNTVIYFDNNAGIQGYATIVGIAANPTVILGYQYIVEPHDLIPDSQYKSICIFEVWIDERKTKLYNFINT